MSYQCASYQAFCDTRSCPLETGLANYLFGEFTLDVASGCLLRADAEIKLRPKVYETLRYLVENPGRLIGKQELMQALWPDSFVTEDSLVQCTLELRRALDDREQQILKTVPRRGYVFTAAVSKTAPPALKPESLSEHDYFDLPESVGQAPGKAPRKLHELPNPRTSLIGRDRHVAEAAALLLRSDLRLLTMTGPGGSGKTRLSIAVASAIADRFTGGSQFIGLSSVTHPDLVASALAEALDLRKTANRSVPELIGEQLQNSGPFLLILDNFEQVLTAASLVADLLEACPSLKVLVTSRSCLHIYGEQEFPVAPLDQNFAIELFAQRAASVRPDFAMTSEDAMAVREICSRVDGLPLAIELAAARTRVLPPSAILDRLQYRLQLLTGGPLDLPERQQAIRKTIDWSHDLLNEAERRLFRRLSVFVGGCTLEAAEAVCNTRLDLGIDLLEGLSSLVDKNLIQPVDRAECSPRFAMLETIREYAHERLRESGELSAAGRAHAAYYLVVAEEGNPELSAAGRTLWLTQCDAEIDNLRSALDWLFQTRDLEWSFRLCVALFRFWDMREHMAEGRSRLETMVRLAGSECTKERAGVLLFLGALTTTQGDYPAAKSFLEQSLSLYEELGDEPGIAATLNALAVSARDRGDYAAAQSSFERSLACWRLLPNRPAMARCLHNLANVVKVRGDYARAQWALREATEIFEELGDRSGAAWSLNQRGDIARAQGDTAAARNFYQDAFSAFQAAGDPWGSARSLTDLACIDHDLKNHSAAHAAYREALSTFAGLGHRRGMARAMEGIACLALTEGDAERALKLAAAAAHLRELIKAPLPQAEQLKLDRELLPAWQSLTEREGRSAWTEGSAMSQEEAVRFSLADSRVAISG